MIKCSDCGKDVDFDVEICPNCGNRLMRKSTHLGLKIVLVLLAVILLGCLFNSLKTKYTISSKAKELATDLYYCIEDYQNSNDASDKIIVYMSAVYLYEYVNTRPSGSKDYVLNSIALDTTTGNYSKAHDELEKYIK